MWDLETDLDREVGISGPLGHFRFDYGEGLSVCFMHCPLMMDRPQALGCIAPWGLHGHSSFLSLPRQESHWSTGL